MKKGPTNLAMGKAPPLFGQCPKENVFLLMMSSLAYTLFQVLMDGKNRSIAEMLMYVGFKLNVHS